MVFLPDLSDGETSDGGIEDFDNTQETFEDKVDEDLMIQNNEPSPNFNTLETMSARSFGNFIKPSQKIRENDHRKH